MSFKRLCTWNIQSKLDKAILYIIKESYHIQVLSYIFDKLILDNANQCSGQFQNLDHVKKSAEKVVHFKHCCIENTCALKFVKNLVANVVIQKKIVQKLCSFILFLITCKHVNGYKIQNIYHFDSYIQLLITSVLSLFLSFHLIA